MAHRLEHADYTVSVEGGFIDHRRWLVHAVVEYRPGLGEDALRRVRGEARLELLLGIVRESRVGRELKARHIHAVVEGDREVAGLFEVLDRKARPLPLRLPHVHDFLTPGSPRGNTAPAS